MGENNFKHFLASKEDTYLESLNVCEEKKLVDELLNNYKHKYRVTYIRDLISIFNIGSCSNKEFDLRDFIPAASNINTTTDELRILYYLKDKVSNKYDFNFRRFMKSIAIHPNTPIEIINELLEIDDYEINKCLCKNPRLTVNILKKLFVGNYFNCFARNISTPKAILSYFLNFEKEKFYVATNIATPYPLLSQLSYGEEDYIRRVSKETIDKKTYLKSNKDLLIVYWYHVLYDINFNSCLEMLK